VLTLLWRSVQAVSVAVNKGDLPQAIDTFLSVVGQDGLGSAALSGCLDAGLEVSAVVAYQGGGRSVLQSGCPVFMVPHQVDSGLSALKESLAGLDVSDKGFGAFGILACTAAKGSEVETVAKVDADGRLIVLDEFTESLDGVLVGHVAMIIAEGYEADRGAHVIR
jgi:hypothetical protein